MLDENTIIKGKTYDTLKFMVQIVLPAIGSLYFGLSQIWDWPAGDKVVGTCAVLALFLGTIIGISHNRYQNSDERFDGTMVVTQDPGGMRNASLELKDPDVDSILNKKEVSFKVNKLDV